MRTVICFVCLLHLLPAFAGGLEERLEKIDSVMQKSAMYVRQKELKLNFMRGMARQAPNPQVRLRYYDELYTAYYTYRFDSAMTYVNRSEELAKAVGNAYYRQRSIIYRSILLATSGLYSQSVENLGQLDERQLDRHLLPDYYMAYVWTYSYWSDYCDDAVYKPRYALRHIAYLEKALKVIPEHTSLHAYVMGEYLYKQGQQDASLRCYLESLKELSVDTRLYAMVTYAIARYYLTAHQYDRYEQYLMLAVISDLVNPLKENLALQEMAMYLFQRYPQEIERANRYINYSMQDARFYHNRLRMIEISNKLPVIMAAYQSHNEEKNRRLRLALAGIGLLAVCLLASLGFIRRQYRQLARKKGELAVRNEQLDALNSQLVATNQLRENYVGLFLDLCAAYIEKLTRYRELVQRKIKARQVNDLLKTVASTRLTEGEAVTFFTRFDAAFLDLYPDFIPQFNRLLREDARIFPKQRHTLTTGLRIFALIRLGVKDSSEIATLLFYSPQTIYNYRSALKNKALRRETFEQDVMQLCTLA